MKKFALLCAALLLLSGCSKPAENQPSPAVTPSQSPDAPVVTSPLSTPTATPETTPTMPVEPIPTSSPEPVPTVTVTPTVSPTADITLWDGDLESLTLEHFPTQLVSSTADTLGGEPIYLIAQLPDYDTWLYGLGGQDSGVILRVSDQWQFFDLTYRLPGDSLPVMTYGDFDGDLEMELSFLFHADNGDMSSVSVDTLHIVEFAPGGVWTDLPFHSDDYTAILDQAVLYSYAGDTRTVDLQVGEERVSYPIPEGEGDYAGPYGFGEQVDFFLDGDSIRASFGAAITHAGSSEGDYIATVSADVVYTGAAFGLDSMHILLI